MSDNSDALFSDKLLARFSLPHYRSTWREEGRSLVFTNGCFDLLHRGHVEYLAQARALGDILLVGVNSDDSVRTLKGADRPLFPEADRCVLLCALECVSHVTVFHETSVESLISEVVPDVLVKGGDYRREEVVGRQIVEATGGQVVMTPLFDSPSTTQLLDRLGPTSSP